jgi:type VII secretion protein EssA
VAKLSFLSILLLFVALPIRSAADSYLGDDGKIKFKVDRLEESDQEKNKKEHKETELDKAKERTKRYGSFARFSFYKTKRE